MSKVARRLTYSNSAHRLRKLNQIRKDQRLVAIATRRNVAIDDVIHSEPSSSNHNQEPISDQLIASDMRSGLRSRSPSWVLTTIAYLRDHLCNDTHDLVTQSIIDNNLLTDIVSLLSRHDQSRIQYEACWTLINITAAGHRAAEEVIKNGGVDALVAVITNATTDSVIGHAIWCLGNLAADCNHFRDVVIVSGVIYPLIDTIKDTDSIVVLKTAIWTLGALVACPCPPFPIMAPVLHVLASVLLQVADQEVLALCCRILSNLPREVLGKIPGNLPIVPRVVHLIGHKNTNSVLVVAALRVLGQFLSGDDEMRLSALDFDNLELFNNLLKFNNLDQVVNETCRTLLRTVRSDSNELDNVLKVGLVGTLVRLAKNGQVAALSTLVYMFNGATYEQFYELIEKGSLDAVVECLASSNLQVLKIAINGLERLLELGAMSKATVHPCAPNPIVEFFQASSSRLQNLELLFQHSSEEVNDRTFRIYEKFFAENDNFDD